MKIMIRIFSSGDLSKDKIRELVSSAIDYKRLGLLDIMLGEVAIVETNEMLTHIIDEKIDDKLRKHNNEFIKLIESYK